MDKINIDTLFPRLTNIPRYGALDVRSLISRNGKQKDIDNIIQAKELKRKRLLKYYKNIYKICIEKIKCANSLGKTDIIYEIPPFVCGCDDYNVKNCLDFIETKLRNSHFDTYIIKPSSLFISWVFIELNFVKTSTDSDKYI